MEPLNQSTGVGHGVITPRPSGPRLVAQGQVARLPDPADRRRAALRLTARGARTNAARAGTVEAVVASALDGMVAPERRAAERVLLRLAGHLTAAAAPVARRSRRRAARPPQSA